MGENDMLHEENALQTTDVDLVMETSKADEPNATETLVAASLGPCLDVASAGISSFKDKLLGKVPTSNFVPEADVTIEQGDVQVDLEGLIPSITFSRRIKEIMSQCMKFAVIVKLLRRFIRQETLHSKISTLWKPTGGFKLTELEGGCYMVKLENAEDYQNAMLGGPWAVLGHYLTVHP